MISWAFRRLQDTRACTSAGDRFRTAIRDDALDPLVPDVTLLPDRSSRWRGERRWRLSDDGQDIPAIK